ncbi:MAG: hypothetical protein RBT62_06935 [Spirochaetia bacterium]|jgi:hypothetical protein|nr:hypothetical protein [Spirochaetia bacterium]
MNMTGVLIALAVQTIVSLILVAWTRRKIRQFLNAGDEIERIRREIGSLIVELDASADRNVTILEDRLGSLRDMIAEADKRAAILAQEHPRRQPEGLVYDRLGRLPESRTGKVAAAKDVETPKPELPFIRFTEKPLSIEEPFADKVVSLFRRGFSSDIIAAHLGVTMAEVDLVIALEQERKNQPGES